ncbi:MAG: HlyD family efflux transporter periplasmic adaptor subunit [Thermoanaerobaculales bacterium]|jgi:HlyD family secretion protein|nr:HlyD family efflux transporter periplasmic adaptor subunit [Thermoanaerobaculales bacterium]
MVTTTARATVLLISAAALAACNPDDSGGRIHASGHIEATDVRLAAKVGGRLLEAPLEEGDEVREGGLVARLDTIDAEHRLAQARATAEAADAQLRLLLAGTRVEDLSRAEDRLAQAQAELDAAVRDFDRLQGLAERGTATEKARDDAETRREVAGRAVDAARSELDKLIRGPRSQEIETARAQRAAADAQVAAVRQQIADATVFAPRNGVLSERIAEPGEVLPPGAPIAVLVDLERPWLDVWVGGPSLASIRLGDPVEVRVDGHDGSFEGAVSFVSDVAEFTPKNVQTPEERAKLVFRVKISLDNRDRIFKPGMPADAWFGAAGPGDAR